MDADASMQVRARLRQWRQWRQDHPQASFDEIEDAVQAEVAHWQAQLVAEVVQGVPTRETPPPRCPACGAGLFPPSMSAWGCLGLSDGSRYSQRMLGWLARLGAEAPFARAAFWLEELTGVVVSAATVRRHTEAVGATAVALGEAEVAALERKAPAPTARPERLALGVDGAMVPLLGGDWGEVKLVSIGEPVSAASAASSAARPRSASPTSRGWQTRRRSAPKRWPSCSGGAWRGRERWPRCRLWEEGPSRVLAILAGWARACPDRPAVATAVAYFRDRQAQLDYPAFRAAGWPVGSGATESGHKQVMQARMKRAGMRWARAHVNPLLALSLLEHHGRWRRDGSAVLAQQRAQRLHTRRTRQQARHVQRVPTAAALAPRCVSLPAPAPLPAALPTAPARHPWRRYGAPLSLKN